MPQCMGAGEYRKRHEPDAASIRKDQLLWGTAPRMPYAPPKRPAFNYACGYSGPYSGLSYRPPPALPVNRFGEEDEQRPPPAPSTHRAPPPFPAVAALQKATRASYRREMLTPEMSKLLIRRAAPFLPTAGQGAGSTGEGSTAMVLIEVNCREGQKTMRHDSAKYQHYLQQVMDELGGCLASGCGGYRIEVAVRPTEQLQLRGSTAAVWDASGHLVPSNVAYLACSPSEVDVRLGRQAATVPDGGASMSRVGAFEVYLVTNFPDIPHVPRCVGLHSKLWSRRWPNAKLLRRKLQEVVEPAFRRWRANDELKVELAGALEKGEADVVREVLERYLDTASPSILADGEARLRVAEVADGALRGALATDGADGYGDISVLRAAIAAERAKSSPSLVASAEARLGQLVADAGLRAAPADLASLRAAIEEHRAKARPEELDVALRRLRVLEDADGVLTEAISAAVVKGLRVAIPECRGHASPCMIREASAKLVALEAEADEALRAAVAEAREAAQAAAAHATYAESATPVALVEAEAKRDAIATADDALAQAMRGSIPTLAAAIAAERGAAGPTAVGAAEAKLAQLQADAGLAAAPADLAAVREAIAAHREKASAEALAEALERERLLDQADTSLQAAVAAEVVKGLRSALGEFREYASPEVASGAAATLARLEAEADEALGLAVDAEAEAVAKRAVYESFLERGTPGALAAAEAKVFAIEAADSALTAALVGGLKELRTAIGEQRHAASPSVVASAAARLGQMAADALLRSSVGGEAVEVRRAIERHRAKATPSVVEETEARLAKVESANTALAEASAAADRHPKGMVGKPEDVERMQADVRALKEAIRLHRKISSPNVCERAEATLRVIEETADAALRADLAKVPTPGEASAIRAVLEHHRETATEAALAEGSARLEHVEDCDAKLRGAMMGTARGLRPAILDGRAEASPSAIVEAISKLRSLEADATAAMRKALNVIPAEVAELKACLFEHRDNATVPMLTELLRRLEVVQAADSNVESGTLTVQERVADLRLAMAQVALLEGSSKVRTAMKHMREHAIRGGKTADAMERTLQALNRADAEVADAVEDLILTIRHNQDAQIALVRVPLASRAMAVATSVRAESTTLIHGFMSGNHSPDRLTARPSVLLRRTAPPPAKVEQPATAAEQPGKADAGSGPWWGNGRRKSMMSKLGHGTAQKMERARLVAQEAAAAAQREHASLKIQAVKRGKKCRDHLKEQHKAVTRINACVRGRLVRIANKKSPEATSYERLAELHSLALGRLMGAGAVRAERHRLAPKLEAEPVVKEKPQLTPEEQKAALEARMRRVEARRARLATTEAGRATARPVPAPPQEESKRDSTSKPSPRASRASRGRESLRASRGRESLRASGAAPAAAASPRPHRPPPPRPSNSSPELRARPDLRVDV